MSYKGIDVSSYQGTIDWTKVKAAGCQFAILKVIRKDLSADKQFENNWAGCEMAEMAVQGVYNYSYATTVAKARSDAEKVLEIIGTDRNPMVWLDVEDDVMKGLGQTLADIINVYGKVITGEGYSFGVYTGLSFYNSYIKPYADQIAYPFWIARYPSSASMEITADPAEGKTPDIPHDLYGWQYSSKGSVPGISGNVDLDIWYPEIEADTSYKQTIAAAEDEYAIDDFVSDSAAIWGTSDKSTMVKKTVTVSTAKNQHHAIVTPLERYMKHLGYYTGAVEADSGKKPVFGSGMKKAIILYQEYVVGAKAKYQDGILTAGAATWKKLYE